MRDLVIDEPRPRATFRLFWLVALANCFALVGVCMTWVDRPVADLIHSIPRQNVAIDLIARAFGQLMLVAIAAAVTLLLAGAWRLLGRPFAPWTRTPLVCLTSLCVALLIAKAVKVAVGRSQVYPQWIELHIHEFHPFGGHGFEAFPSATMTAAGAVLAVLWLRVPWVRVPATLLLLATGFAIVLINGHWVSDIVGGAFLGLFVGWGAVRLVDRRPSPSGVSP